MRKEENNIKIKNTKRYFWIDLLKIIACFWVIVNHSSGYLLEITGNTNLSVGVYSFIFTCCKCAVPIFIMVTGYLLLNSKKELNYKYSFTKIIRILVPLVGLSFIAFIIQNGIKDLNLISFIKSFLAAPIIIPYWYLYMLIGIYILIVILQKIKNSLSDLDYKIIITITLLIPGIMQLIKTLLGFSFSEYFMISLLPSSIGLLLTGHYLSKLELKRKNFIISISVFSVSVLGMFSYMFVNFLQKGIISYSFDSAFSIFSIMIAMSTFYICRYLFEKKNINVFVNKVVCSLSDATFGIYLIHYFLIYKIYTLVKSLLMINPYIGLLCLQIIVFLVCYVIITILRKIKILKKFL